MDVDTKNTEATSQRKGETYYFCGAECKKDFDKKPEKYSAGKQHASR
jgi:YHS domain-containing protein